LTSNAGTKPERALGVGARLELNFHDLLTNGQAVGRHDGAVVFCFGPLPGERGVVAIEQVKPKYAVGRLLELTKTSPDRNEPFCPVFGSCGGCQVQHWSYAAQLSWKQRVVRDALQRIGGFSNPAVADTIGMTTPKAYRNKMSLVVDRAGGDTRLGFYRQRSHDVVPIDACPIVMPRLSDYIAELQHPESSSGKDALASALHIVARASSQGTAVVTFTTSRPSNAVARSAPEFLDALPGVAGIINSYDPSGANAILGRHERVLAGTGEIEETIAGIRYRVPASSFFQVNPAIVDRIFAYIEERAAPVRRVLDLYCGVGTFSLFFARRGATVFGIEEHSAAIAEARINAELNGLTEKTTFVAGRVEQMRGSAAAEAALRHCELAFLDPPRKGSDEATLSALASAGVPSIWYLSCDPATLARDLKFLTAKGYGLDTVQPFDMFPQTGHVEVLATMRRNSSSAE
jgi:23S rRNA (uracil1939-C5)-methyltransferase